MRAPLLPRRPSPSPARRPRGSPPTPWWARLLAVVGAVLVLAGAGLVASPRRAAAEVVHGLGWSATVAGWSSWYGSYGMGDLGTAWCIDHGSAAPDAEFGYVPANLSAVPADTQAAMAWALGAAGADADRVGAAALMLVLHDLMGATYPAGPLDVDALDPGALSGFDGAEADVVARARAIKADAVAHAGVRGPLAMTAAATEAEPGATGTLTVTVADAGGNGVAGVRVRAAADGAQLGSDDGVTGDDGRATFQFVAGPAEVRFAASASAPDPTLQAYASSSTPAQRVAVPRQVTLRADTGFAPSPSTVRVDKSGDAEPYLPVGGARFEVVRRGQEGGAEPVGTLVTRDDGTTDELPVAPGAYEVREVEPPPGYRPAGPWRVEVAAGDRAVVEVVDEAVPGWARITKVDAGSGEPVAGATLALSYDADADGTYETELDPIVTGAEPAEVRLKPGDYRLTEVRAPDGYEGLDHPVDFSVRPGERVEVTVENEAVAAIAFRKIPVGPVDPDQVVLAGAVFEVRPEDGGPPVGTCTTDQQGRCSLPTGSVDAGARYCWIELEAPPGFGTAEPGCVEVEAGGTVTTVEVREPSHHTEVTGDKVDAETGEPVAGATYDLYRRTGGEGDGDGRLPAPTAPEDAVGVEEAVWVARATSDEQGTVAWGPQVPGSVYCALEREAPAGYRLDPTPRCMDAVLAPGERAVIRLPDQPEGTPPTTTPPTTSTTSPPPTTTAPPTTAPPTTQPPTPTTEPRPPVGPVPPPPVPTLPPVTAPSPGPRTSLPATGAGAKTAGLASVGGGLLFLGLAAVTARPGGDRRRPPPEGPPPGGAGGDPATRPARPAPPRGARSRFPVGPGGSLADRWRRRS